MFKKTVWDDLSCVTWCIILLEVAIRRCVHCIHKGWHGPQHYTTTTSLKRWNKAGWIHAFMFFTPNSDPILWMYQMASTVTRSQSNSAHMGCGGTGDSHHGCAADKSATPACCLLSCRYGPKSRRNVSKTLFNLCHEALRQLWRQKGFQHGTSKVYLIKWPVSVCVCNVCIYIYIYIYTYTHTSILYIL